MIYKSIIKPLLICVSIIWMHTLTVGQTTVTVGQIQNGSPVLTITTAQFNTAMASAFSGSTFSNLQLLSGTDVNGLFYYLKADELISSTTHHVVIVLEQSGSNINFSSTNGCKMECNWTGSCLGCDQEITEKCKSQRCQCNLTDGSGGFGGCSSSISFPDDK